MKSPLTAYTKISPNHYSGRYYNGKNWEIDNVTIHHVVGQVSVESLGAEFAKTSRRASATYGIGHDGRIGCYVDEADRPWTSSSGANDARSITIEVADDPYPPYKVNARAYESLINLLVDIVKRNPGFGGSLRWKNNKNLILDKKQQNMTIHKWFAATSCPGDFLEANMGNIADEVNKRLKANVEPQAPIPVEGADSGKVYKVQAGAFSKLENATAHQAKLKAAGFANTFVTTVDRRGLPVHTIQVGAYKGKPNASAMLNKLKKAGFEAFIYEG